MSLNFYLFFIRVSETNNVDLTQLTLFQYLQYETVFQMWHATFIYFWARVYLREEKFISALEAGFVWTG
jgi:hypothetical protein